MIELVIVLWTFSGSVVVCQTLLRKINQEDSSMPPWRTTFGLAAFVMFWLTELCCGLILAAFILQQQSKLLQSMYYSVDGAAYFLPSIVAEVIMFIWIFVSAFPFLVRMWDEGGKVAV